MRKIEFNYCRAQSIAPPSPPPSLSLAQPPTFGRFQARSWNDVCVCVSVCELFRPCSKLRTWRLSVTCGAPASGEATRRQTRLSDVDNRNQTTTRHLTRTKREKKRRARTCQMLRGDGRQRAVGVQRLGLQRAEAVGAQVEGQRSASLPAIDQTLGQVAQQRVLHTHTHAHTHTMQIKKAFINVGSVLTTSRHSSRWRDRPVPTTFGPVNTKRTNKQKTNARYAHLHEEIDRRRPQLGHYRLNKSPDPTSATANRPQRRNANKKKHTNKQTDKQTRRFGFSVTSVLAVVVVVAYRVPGAEHGTTIH